MGKDWTYYSHFKMAGENNMNKKTIWKTTVVLEILLLTMTAIGIATKNNTHNK